MTWPDLAATNFEPIPYTAPYTIFVLLGIGDGTFAIQ